MSYHDLSECTLSPDERLDEANELADLIVDELKPEQCTQSEQSVVSLFYDRRATFCSVKQLFWLRDIKDKYL
jgi:hypothetical protein